MARRAYVLEIHIGENRLPAEAAHHVRNVLRLTVGESVELFTQAGATAAGTLVRTDAADVVVNVTELWAGAGADDRPITIAAALPKGDRAEWMVEKLSELGVARLIPLAAERSVVLPAGQNKLERWRRIAVEAARQSGRAGVMTIDALTPVAAAMGALSAERGWAAHLSTAPGASPLASRCDEPGGATLFIGPEGGWTAGEIARFEAAGVVGVGLTRTVLRVETAAVVAAALLACRVPQ